MTIQQQQLEQLCEKEIFLLYSYYQNIVMWGRFMKDNKPSNEKTAEEISKLVIGNKMLNSNYSEELIKRKVNFLKNGVLKGLNKITKE